MNEGKGGEEEGKGGEGGGGERGEGWVDTKLTLKIIF